ncbi:tyrosine aminotransferase, putative [Trypanosoma cruzi]|nr:tyrosine aminotransferase, putative [Trypanosoma cruzi]
MPRGAMYLMSRIDLEKYRDIKTDVEFFREAARGGKRAGAAWNHLPCTRLHAVTTTRPVEVYREAVERIKAFCQRHAAV